MLIIKTKLTMSTKKSTPALVLPTPVIATSPVAAKPKATTKKVAAVAPVVPVAAVVPAAVPEPIKAAQKTKFAFPIMFAISFSAFFESWLVGSLSPFAFMGMFVFSILTDDDIAPQIVESKKGDDEISDESVIKPSLT